MKNFSYTKSSTLNEQIMTIEELRTKLLLKPISPRKELRFQWNAYLRHIKYYLALSGDIVSEIQIRNLFAPQGKKHIDDTEKKIIGYKNALDFLYHEWLVNGDLITAKIVIRLYEKAFSGKLKIAEKDLDTALQYAQINPEYPIIQAALAQYFILDLDPFTTDNEGLSYLVFLMFLYKTGYDFRRMLTIEKYYYDDLARYKNLIAQLNRSQNLTNWLEYVTSGVIKETKIILEDLEFEHDRTDNNNDTFALNDRQRTVLSILTEPQSKISNKTIQKMFKVSQITASRDLSKLTSLGLLLAIGKGRSTYYTRV